MTAQVAAHVARPSAAQRLYLEKVAIFGGMQRRERRFLWLRNYGACALFTAFIGYNGIPITSAYIVGATLLIGTFTYFADSKLCEEYRVYIAIAARIRDEQTKAAVLK